MIIDEEINLFQIEKLTKLDIEKIKEVLKIPDIELYEKFDATFSLKKVKKISGYKRISLGITENMVNGFLKEFNNRITDNLIERNRKFLDKQKDFYDKKSPTFDKKEFVKKIERLKIFSGEGLVLNFSEDVYGMKTSDYFTRLGTKKILLDASGRFHSIYDSGKFKVHKFDRIKSNENISIHYGKLNTSSSSKKKKDRKHKEIYEYLYRFIIEKTSTEDKVLIIGKDDDKKHLKDKFGLFFNNDKKDKKNNDASSRFSFENYQSMRGRNEYGDYDKLFIIHTDNLPKPYYILTYEFYSGEYLDEDKLEMDSEKFRYEPLERYRQDCILSSFYQGVKRIGRHMDLSKKHDVYILTKEENLIKTRLKAELKDVNMVDIEVPYF